MADLSIDFCGIKSPNPFWLASAPPTDKAYNVVRAFEAGWGGVVWKTLGEDPPAVNVSSRYSAHYGKNREVIGFNNIELITDRSLDINLREITAVKKAWPDRAMIVSLMLPCEEAPWAAILPLVEATGAEGDEFGGIAPVADAADAGDRQAGGNRIACDLGHHVQGDRLHGRTAIAAVGAGVAHLRERDHAIQVEVGDRIDRVDQRDRIGPARQRRARRGAHVGDVGREFHDHG